LRSELTAFIEAVRTGGPPAVTGEEGVASLDIATRCLADRAAAAVSRPAPRMVAG
jgi:predicted dehydrogenase